MNRPLRCPRCRSLKIGVDVLKGNYSSFSGYRFTFSRYSQVRCMENGCGAMWRTRSDAVFELHNKTVEQTTEKP